MNARARAPLRGVRVVLCCSRLKSGRFLAALGELGADAIYFPTIDIRPLRKTPELDRALDRLDANDWIVFTSAYAVECFLGRARERSVAVEKSKARVCAVGPATAEALEDAGISVALVPDDFVAEGVLAALGSVAGLRILLPRAQEARDFLPRELGTAGASVDVAPCYENVPAQPSSDLIARVIRQPPAALLFTSSSTARNFAMLLGAEQARTLLAGSIVGALGPVTARTLSELGAPEVLVGRENTFDSLLQALAEKFL